MTSSDTIKLQTPLTEDDVLPLRVGDKVSLTGVIYSARDSAHKRMVEALARGEELPFDPEGAVIYYMGPSPAPEGRPIGAAGPTTSYRMDSYAPALYRAGVKATMGKGGRSRTVREAIVEFHGLYLAAVGGAGALLSQCITDAEVIAYDDLGPEAVRRLTVEQFPAVVVNDAAGNDLYEMAVEAGRGT